MATATLKIDCRMDWVWQDGDGRSCFYCSDTCFLRQFSANLIVGNQKAFSQSIPFCQSCGTVIEERLKLEGKL